ncbi:type II toxin-antitoxin system RelE/ParE family toxin [candidate division KSB1 bacterium]
MNIIFGKEASHFLEKLPKDISRRIYNKIMSTENNPFHFFERLEGNKFYKLRVGDYRVIADIDKQINIRFIGHRKNIYEKV